MGGRIKKQMIFFLALLFVCRMEADGADLQTADVSIEQISVRMPEITLCIGGSDNDELTQEEIEVYRGCDLLETVSLTPLSETSFQTEIYVLLDVSFSIGASDFEAAKQAICELYEQRADSEKIVLVTFGDEVRLIVDGTQEPDAALEKIRGIERDSQSTNLFEGIRRVTELTERRDPQEFVHTVVVVITDGMDTSLGGATLQEAAGGLKRQGVPLYGLANQRGARDSINRFGEFVRSAGGKMEIWNADDMQAAMGRILENCRSVQLLTVKAEDNLVSYEMEQCTVIFRKWNVSKSAEVYIGKWTPDREAPEISGAVQTGGNALTVTFSEPLNGMEEAANYQLWSEGTLYVPVSVKRTDTDQVRICFEGQFYDGDYALSCINMTDISMEQNPLDGKVEITLSGSGEGSREGRGDILEGEMEKGFSGDTEQKWRWLAAGCAVIAAAGILVFIMRRAGRKKGQEVTEETLTFDRCAASKKHIVVGAKKGVELIFYPRNCGSAGPIRHIMTGSVIVGRADMCEIYFDDALMSRQHFALEFENGKMVIQDLETRNGTCVNGVKIRDRRVLQKRDVISAGSLELMVDWQDEGNE